METAIALLAVIIMAALKLSGTIALSWFLVFLPITLIGVLIIAICTSFALLNNE